MSKRRTLPVAADFSTPVNEEVGTHVFGHLSFLGFFRPQRALEYSGLYSFTPLHHSPPLTTRSSEQSLAAPSSTSPPTETVAGCPTMSATGRAPAV